MVESLAKILAGFHHRILSNPAEIFRILCRILQDPKQDPTGSYRIVCRILNNPVGSCEDFYDPKHILCIAGSSREACKIVTKGFNKEFLPGCLTEHLFIISCALV